MFKLQPKPTFKARVPITIPGEVRPAEIEVEFKHMTVDGVQNYFENLGGKKDAEALSEIVVGWSGVDAPYDADALATLLNNFPSASAAMFEAFRRELFEARRKN
jgi:hypothetical protein